MDRGGAISRNLVLTVGALWSVLVVCGFAALGWHEFEPGANGSVPLTWPSGSTLNRPTDRPTILLFAHPMCPCTRASLRELTQIISNIRNPADFCVVFARPEGTDSGWSHGLSWNVAAGIPGVRVVEDFACAEVRRFSVVTSGHVLAFDARGSLRFSGGITGSRGHDGDNYGRAAVIHFIEHGGTGCISSPVFGCLLRDDDTGKMLKVAS